MKFSPYAALIFSLIFALIFMFFPITASAIKFTTHEERIMDGSSKQAPQLPPEVAMYLKEASPESKQFDFLIGNWDVAATKYKADGTVLMQYKAIWIAQHLNDGRMIMDDFKALAPTGQEISSLVTLRTYSEVMHRWEMSGLAARQPAWNATWHGQWKEGEMLVEAIGKSPDGITITNKIRFFNIAKDSFNWESRISMDDGKTWGKTATLIATRIEK
jgi:hypothetical protein